MSTDRLGTPPPLTTGACVALAAGAAAGVLEGIEPDGTGETELPDGRLARLPVELLSIDSRSALVSVVKPANDDRDSTAGMRLEVEVSRSNDQAVSFGAGPGVGRVSLPGLNLAPGEPAINPIPRRMVEAAMPADFGGAVVTVSVPGGESLARRTFNSRLGIVGGLSILGTTGLVRPMSVDAWKKTIELRVDIAWAAGGDIVVLTPGRLGAHAAAGMGFAGESLVEMGNFVGYTLEKCRRAGFSGCLLVGHPGKLFKVADGEGNTDHRVARLDLSRLARLTAETEAALAEIIGRCRSAETACRHLLQAGRESVLAEMAMLVSWAAEDMVGGELEVRTVLTNLAGRAIGVDPRVCLVDGRMTWS